MHNIAFITLQLQMFWKKPLSCHFYEHRHRNEKFRGLAEVTTTKQWIMKNYFSH